jgi:uncharacterized protein YgfB (UPF0149 family)
MECHFDGIEEISSPSELHGLLTGIVCVTQAPTTDEWSQILNTSMCQLYRRSTRKFNG